MELGQGSNYMCWKSFLDSFNSLPPSPKYVILEVPVVPKQEGSKLRVYKYMDFLLMQKARFFADVTTDFKNGFQW